MNCTVIDLLRVTLMIFVEILKKIVSQNQNISYAIDVRICKQFMSNTYNMYDFKQKICHPILGSINLIKNNLYQTN